MKFTIDTTITEDEQPLIEAHFAVPVRNEETGDMEMIPRTIEELTRIYIEGLKKAWADEVKRTYAETLTDKTPVEMADELK